MTNEKPKQGDRSTSTDARRENKASETDDKNRVQDLDESDVGALPHQKQEEINPDEEAGRRANVINPEGDPRHSDAGERRKESDGTMVA